MTPFIIPLRELQTTWKCLIHTQTKWVAANGKRIDCDIVCGVVSRNAQWYSIVIFDYCDDDDQQNNSDTLQSAKFKMEMHVFRLKCKM